MKATPVLLFFFVLLWPQKPGVVATDQFVVWNVGQGQWSTLAKRGSCFHFDMGGEFADWEAIERLCRKRENRVYFSHWDLDHISFARKARQRLPGLCISAAPNGYLKQKWKRNFLEALPTCPKSSMNGSGIREITPPNISLSDPNSASRVFAIDERIVVPGDSTKDAEKAWGPQVPARAETLILGHHGSRTSTSEFLLKRMSQAKMAIATARRRKYGHPHPEIVERARSKGIAVISTEDWGHLRLEITSRSPAGFTPAKKNKIRP